ncbi:MAG TPA: hypothetical protein VEH07_06845 [Alphaproteobacteria bacterium]|nr:hypothetical protein [Alphaproteobacteria bacterium]
MKYQPLEIYLRHQGRARVPMTFKQVESVLRGALPRSARKHRPWWANDPTGHAHAKAWIAAGYRTEQVDMEGEKLVFVRSIEASTGKQAPAMEAQAARVAAAAHPILGALKGLLWLAPGIDLTAPAYPAEEWEKTLQEKYDS